MVLSFVTLDSCFILLSCPDYKTGFGGKFGVQSDRKDKSAHGWEHHEKVDKHESQKGWFTAYSLVCFVQLQLVTLHSTFDFVQTTRQASAEISVSKLTEWINPL